MLMEAVLFIRLKVAYDVRLVVKRKLDKVINMLLIFSYCLVFTYVRA